MAGGACLPRHQGKGEAAYLRGHRQVLERALEWGCTPKEAERRLRREELQRERESWFGKPEDPRAGHDDTPEDTRPYWQRD
jgi:hypothetical protein